MKVCRITMQIGQNTSREDALNVISNKLRTPMGAHAVVRNSLYMEYVFSEFERCIINQDCTEFRNLTDKFKRLHLTEHNCAFVHQLIKVAIRTKQPKMIDSIVYLVDTLPKFGFVTFEPCTEYVEELGYTLNIDMCRTILRAAPIIKLSTQTLWSLIYGAMQKRNAELLAFLCGEIPRLSRYLRANDYKLINYASVRSSMGDCMNVLMQNGIRRKAAWNRYDLRSLDRNMWLCVMKFLDSYDNFSSLIRVSRRFYQMVRHVSNLPRKLEVSKAAVHCMSAYTALSVWRCLTDLTIIHDPMRSHSPVFCEVDITSLGFLPHLRFLNLSSTRFTARSPVRCDTVEVLVIDKCLCEDLENLVFPNLKALRARYVYGSLADQLHLFPQLTILDMFVSPSAMSFELEDLAESTLKVIHCVFHARRLEIIQTFRHLEAVHVVDPCITDGVNFPNLIAEFTETFRKRGIYFEICNPWTEKQLCGMAKDL